MWAAVTAIDSECDSEGSVSADSGVSGTVVAGGGTARASSWGSGVWAPAAQVTGDGIARAAARHPTLRGSSHSAAERKRVKVLSATVGSTKRQRACTHRGLDFDVAYRLLVGGGPASYTRRPDCVRAMRERQIFVERPPKRRRWGESDRWRNSGGMRGGVILWVNEQHGVRKRYGTIVRVGRPTLGFQQFSLVVRDSDADDAAIAEDGSAYVYAVEGCGPETPRWVRGGTRLGSSGAAKRHHGSASARRQRGHGEGR